MEAISLVFALWTWPFWLLAIASFVVFLIDVAREKYYISPFVAAFLVVLYGKPLLALNWPLILTWAGIYVAIAIPYSVPRYWWFVRQTVNKYKETYNRTTLTTEDLVKIRAETQASNHKAKIVGWMIFWPINLFWLVFRDTFNMGFDKLRNVYRRVQEKALS